MQKFKKMKGCKRPEEVQGLIFYTCLDYKNQPQHIRQKIDRLCVTACKDEAKSAALKEWITTGCNVTYVSMKYHWSDTALYAARRRFYNSW